MSDPAITLLMRDHDYLAPLYGGDVVPEGIRLTIDRATPMTRAYTDASILAAELSFSRFLIGLSNGDRTFVGIPFFPIRAFRHRCFFVRRDGGLNDVKQLHGKRIGTNGWQDTGNTWTRAVLREHGVRIDQIHWLVGPVDDQNPTNPQGDFPPHVRPAPAGRSLRDMLLSGDLDAVMCPVPPKGFYAADGKMVRLIPDYRRAEQEYYRRTGIFPPHHIVGLRRDIFERSPQIAPALYRALDQARLLWQQRRFYYAELTPWVLAELEETTSLMGDDWKPSGVRANRKGIEGLCAEEYAQGLIERPIDPAVVFAEFEAVLHT